MANKIKCTCGHSWDKSSSSKKDMNVCHICGKDNTMKNGGWLDAYGDVPEAQMGTMVTPLDFSKPLGTLEGVSEVMSAPARTATYLLTGKYQDPSQALGIKNPVGAFATDMILDPVNLMGAGAVKASGAYKNAYKLNPWAFKANPEDYYRMIGETGFDDAMSSGLIRSKKMNAYPEPYFGKGKIPDGEYSNPKSTAINPKTGKRIPTRGYPGPYMIQSKVPMKGVGAWADEVDPLVGTPSETVDAFDPRFAFYKQNWLKGYKEVPKSKKKQDGGWLDKFDVPQAQNGIEGTMGGLTDKGFNYNGAWGGTMQMGGAMPGAVGFTYARTGSIPSNGPYAKKTKASAQDGRAISDNTRLKPIIIDEPINRETVRSTNKSYVMSPQEALLNKLKGVKLKESQDRLNKTAEKITAVGSLSPNPLIRIPSAAANFTLGAMNSPTPTDRGLDYMGLFGSTPSSLNSFKQIGRRAPFFKGITALDALSDIFEFTPSEDLPKKQNGGEMKFYQEGLDWKPRNISQDGSKNPKKRTIILAEHNPEFWDNPDSGKVVTAVNPFITEAAGIKKYVNKYFPNEDVEVIPTYKQNIKEALAKSDPNTRLVVMGHSGNRMFGIPTTEFIESVGNTKYENCYAGICYGDKLPGIGEKERDKEVVGKMVPGRFPESYNLQNFNIRSNKEKWVGFAPVDRGGEEGFRDSFFRRTTNPEVNKLRDQLKKIWSSQSVEYEKKIKAAEPIESKLNKIYSQNRQIVNLPKAADTKELDYIPIPARTANYGKDPLTFDPQRKEQGGEIPVDPMGYWNPDNVGEPVIIPSNEITMEGVYQPLLGISDTGDTQMMYPGEDYEFDGESVTEYPMMQKGGRVPIYVDNPNDPKLRAYNDSLNLYNSYKNVKKAYEDRGYETHYPASERWVNVMNEELKKPLPNKIAGYKNDDETFYVREINPSGGGYYANTKIPMQLYNPNIRPKGMQIAQSTREEDSWDKKSEKSIPKHILIDKNKIKKSIKEKSNEGFFKSLVSGNATDALPFWDYSNVEPKQEVILNPPVPKKPKPQPLKKKSTPQPTPQPIQEQPVKTVEQPKPVERKQNVYEGTPVYSATVGSGGPSALVGFANQKGDTTYIKPEDYERFGVPKYGKEFIQNRKKQRNGGVNNADAQPIEKLDQLLNFTNYNKPTKGGWLDKYQ